MYQAAIIKREAVYISKETGDIVNNLTSEQKLLDGFNAPKKYIYVELFSKVSEVKAKTKRELEPIIWQIAEQNNLGYDFEVYFYNKKSKANV